MVFSRNATGHCSSGACASDWQPAYDCRHRRQYDGGYGVQQDSSYPSQLQKELGKRGYGYRVVNQGVTGSTSVQAFSRLNRALAAQPEIVIVQLGGNDAAQGISRVVSRETLHKIIARFKSGGARIYFA